MQVQKILFTTDFSDCAERAFSHASYLAAHFTAELHVLNVTNAGDSNPGNPLGYIPLQPEDDVTWSDAYKGDRIEGEIPVVHSMMEAESIVSGILDYAESHAIDLIVMGTHGRTGIDHLLSGSVAEDVVRHATCPAFTVRCEEARVWKDSVQRILVPVDFSEFTPLGTALELARAYGAEMDVVHVIEEAMLPTIYGVEPLSPGAPLYVQRAKGALDKLIRKEEAEGVTIRTHIRIGHPARRILEIANERNSDLIVLASHGRTGLGRLLMGSVAEKVVRLAEVPVFTLKLRSENPAGPARTANTARA